MKIPKRPLPPPPPSKKKNNKQTKNKNKNKNRLKLPNWQVKDRIDSPNRNERPLAWGYSGHDYFCTLSTLYFVVPENTPTQLYQYAVEVQG